VNAIQLQELGVVLTDFLLHMTGIEISGEAIAAVLLFVEGDVVRTLRRMTKSPWMVSW